MTIRVPRYMVPQQVGASKDFRLTEQGKIEPAALSALLALPSETDKVRPSSGLVDVR